MSEYFLLDTNVLLALYWPHDNLHIRAVNMVTSLRDKKAQFATVSLVIQECVTVISMRKGMDSAKDFYAHYGTIIEKVIQFDEQLEDKAWRIFLKQKKKGTSFVDCALVATAKKLGMKDILTYYKWFKSCGFPLQYTQS